MEQEKSQPIAAAAVPSNSAGEIDIDKLIERLLDGIYLVYIFSILMFIRIARNSRPGKLVQMSETEIRYLCIKSKQIFLEQPTLLELEAPIKICGKQ